MSNEVLINLRPQTTHEKLIWERSHNKELKKQVSELKIQLGELQSDYDELIYRMKKEEIGSLILKNRKQKDKVKELNDKLKKMKVSEQELICKLAKYNLLSGDINNDSC